MGPSEHPPSDPRILAPGALFHARYEVEQLIGAGALGAVYRVTDRRTKHARALKLMRPIGPSETLLRERFLQEATITAAIDSEHIALSTDAGIDAETNLPFLVMELLKGESLGARMRRQGRLPADEVVTLLSQAARALDRTHAAGVVHRDLKPENLFVTHRDDGTLCLKILDFGMAKLMSQLGEQTASIAGTPKYMAPEQFDGKASPSSDRYALGQLAYHMLVGAHYWSEDFARGAPLLQLALLMQQGVSEPASVRAERAGATLSSAFDAWFERAAARGPEARFDSAADLVAALVAALACTDEPTEEPRASQHFPSDASVSLEAREPAAKPRVGLWAGIVALACVVVLALTQSPEGAGASEEPAQASAAESSPSGEPKAATTQHTSIGALEASPAEAPAPAEPASVVSSPASARQGDGAPRKAPAALEKALATEATRTPPSPKPATNATLGQGSPTKAGTLRTFDQEDGPAANVDEF